MGEQVGWIVWGQLIWGEQPWPVFMWLSTGRCLMVTLVCLGVYLALGCDVDHSRPLVGQCVYASGHFRSLGLGLSTLLPFPGQAPFPLSRSFLAPEVTAAGGREAAKANQPP